MKFLAIGGTGFIGPFVIEQLQRAGHRATVFHRGKAHTPAGVQEILGDRNSLSEHRSTFDREQFDLVIDFILSSERQAKQLIDTFRGIAGRVVALSSMDVYRAWGVFYGFEPGGLEPMPVDETSSVRTQAQTYPPAVLKKTQAMLPWLDDEYDKVKVERVVLDTEGLSGTVVRLPMVYGPGDYAHRFYPSLKRMDDARPHILFADDVAAMRTPRGYVENVAAGIVLAATSDKASGQIYNICEAESFSELEWARKIAATTGWKGEFVVLPHAKTPPHLHWPGNTAQHLVVSSEKIRTQLNYREPIARDEAIRRTILWEREHPPGDPPALNYEAEDQAVARLKDTA